MNQLARSVAEALHRIANRHRESKGLRTVPFSEALYERGLIICRRACQIRVRDAEQLVKYGFRQHVTRILVNPHDPYVTVPDQIFDVWGTQRMNGWNVYTEHSYSAVAVLMHGNHIFISYSQTDSIAHPAMRILNPTSIVQLPPMEPEDQTMQILSQHQLEVITDSIHTQLNVRLLPEGKFLNYSEKLNRVARYYCREAAETDFANVESSEMFIAVSNFDVTGREPNKLLGLLIADTLLDQMEIPDIQREFDCGLAALSDDTNALYVGLVLI